MLLGLLLLRLLLNERLAKIEAVLLIEYARLRDGVA